MSSDPPLTQYRQDIVRSNRKDALRENIVTPDEAEQTAQLVSLNTPQEPPIVIRRLGKVVPPW